MRLIVLSEVRSPKSVFQTIYQRCDLLDSIVQILKYKALLCNITHHITDIIVNLIVICAGILYTSDHAVDVAVAHIKYLNHFLIAGSNILCNAIDRLYNRIGLINLIL